MEKGGKCGGPRVRGVFPWESENQIPALLKLASTTMRRDIEKAIRPLGLTPQQGQCLRALSVSPGLTHSDLEHLLCVEKPSITSLINGMEKKGWVTRRQHPEDARIKRVFLTKAGEEMCRQSIDVVEEAKRRFTGALTEQESGELCELLRKLVQTSG